MKALERILVECPRVRPAGDHRGGYAGIPARSDRSRPIPSDSSTEGCVARAVAARESASGTRPVRTLIDPAGITLCRACGCPIPLPRLKSVAGYEYLHDLCGRRGEAARLASLPPAAGRQAKMSTLRASDDRSPE